MNDWEKFEENCFPPIKAFCSKLIRVWREFGMTDLGDCHDDRCVAVE